MSTSRDADPVDGQVGSEQPRDAFGAHDRAQPPHPFRVAPWYDPRVMTPKPVPEPRRVAWRIVLVLLGGTALPLASAAVNQGMNIVALGVFGHLALVLSSLFPLAHVLWMPSKRRGKGSERHVEAPGSTLALAAFTVAGVLSTLFWGYLALLFLPILPLSLIALIVLGLGLCGLCPFITGGISLGYTIRSWRQLRTRWPRSRALTLVLLSALVPCAIALTLGIRTQARAAALRRGLDAVAATRPLSTARMRAIANLEATVGRSSAPRQLRLAILEEGDMMRRRTIAETYQRITDRPLPRLSWRGARTKGEIRPWWFVSGRRPFSLRLLRF